MNGPVILANGQAYTIQGNYAVPAQEVSGENMLGKTLFHGIFFIHFDDKNINDMFNTLYTTTIT